MNLNRLKKIIQLRAKGTFQRGFTNTEKEIENFKHQKLRISIECISKIKDIIMKLINIAKEVYLIFLKICCVKNGSP